VLIAFPEIRCRSKQIGIDNHRPDAIELMAMALKFQNETQFHSNMRGADGYWAG